MSASTILYDGNLPLDESRTFSIDRCLLWEEQLKAATSKDSRSMRWHPMLINWHLNLKLISSASYHALRTSGFKRLPSERTLRDYSNGRLTTSYVKKRISTPYQKKKKCCANT